MVQFYDPTQEAEIKRRRRMDEMLQQQGQSRPTEVVSGYAVPQSGFEGLARGLAGFAGGYEGAKADQQEAQLEQTRAKRMAEIMQQMQTNPNAAAGALMQDPATQGMGFDLYKGQMDADRRMQELQAKEGLREQKWQRDAELKRELAAMKSGMMVDPDTGQIVPNPNAGSQKPLPVGALKLQDELTAEIGGFKNVASDATNWAKKIRSGAVPLTPSGKIEAFVLNRIGASDEASRNVAGFNTFLEKMRNDLLLLAKGVQTEGDAKRALAAIAAAGNDPVLMAEAMEQAAKVQLRGAALSTDRLNKVLKNYGQPELPKEETPVNDPLAAGSDPRVAAAKAAGYTDAEIEQYLKGR